MLSLCYENFYIPLRCARGAINRLDQRYTASSLTSIAGRSTVLVNCADEILDCTLMSARIRDQRRRGAQILVAWFAAADVLPASFHVCRHNPIMLEHYRALGAGKLNSARISGIARGPRFQHAHCPIHEFKQSQPRVLGFD